MEADKIFAKAERIRNRFRLSDLWNKEEKYEKASHLYVKAGNKYKLNKLWSQAGNSFLKAAKCHEDSEKIDHYVSAYKCLKRIDVNATIACLQTIIKYYKDNGKYSLAARYLKELGEVDEDHSLKWYHKAAEMYEIESQDSAMYQCYLKIIPILLRKEEYDKALPLFNKIMKQCSDNNLLKFKLSEHLFYYVLCYLCLDDLVIARNRLIEYEICDHSREYQFVSKLIDIIYDNNLEQFQILVNNYDSISRIDEIGTKMLLNIKNKIGNLSLC